MCYIARSLYYLKCSGESITNFQMNALLIILIQKFCHCFFGCNKEYSTSYHERKIGLLSDRYNFVKIKNDSETGGCSELPNDNVNLLCLTYSPILAAILNKTCLNMVKG